MIITLDTNILYASLYSSSGASHQILRLILDEKLQVAISTPVYFEYYDVLTRAENLRKINLTINEVEDVLDLLALLAKKYSIYFLLRPNLSDEKDNMFVECAFASNSQYLITSNVRDFKRAELKGFSFQIITPGDFLKTWRETYE
jgi:putative PIN family toxin of toxin-antitoxin system